MLKFIIASALLVELPAAAAGELSAQATYVAAAPPADRQFPATSAPVQIPVAGVTVDGNLLVASGEGPHPTLVICNGLPGVERNLDLAQAARRAGWNVLVFHYRGAWGSRGEFSLANAAADGEAAVAFVRDPAMAAKYRIDPSRIVLLGHSVGGFVAAKAAGRDAAIGVILLDA